MSDLEMVPQPTPQIAELALAIAGNVLLNLAGEQRHMVAEAMIRAAAAVCIECAKPGYAPDLLLLGADMFRRWALTGQPTRTLQ